MGCEIPLRLAGDHARVVGISERRLVEEVRRKGDVMMKKKWLLPAMVGGVIGGIIMPVKWRAKLSRPLVPYVAGMVEHIPDG